MPAPWPSDIAGREECPFTSAKKNSSLLQAALSACGLAAAEQQMIASGNALKLLGIP
jgi:hypothetical protein